jgi:hypothetical protein
MIQKTTPEVGASGAGIISSALPNKKSPGPSPGNHVTQALNPVDVARRELLRDFVFEAATEAAAYLGAVQNFVAADDVPGVRYSATKFVILAREVAKGCRELTASDAGSP